MIIAVISPTYKEEDNIAALVEAVFAQKPLLPKNTELHLIISDSHSPDRTAEVTLEIAKQNPNLHYLDCQVRGIGVGIVEGFKYAIDQLHADILIQIDADLSHPPEVIPIMIQKIESGYDLVCGSRYAPGGSNGYGWYRSLQSYCANQFCRLVLGVYQLNEFMTSFRAMRRETFQKVNLDKIPWRARSFVFQAAFVYELIRGGAKFIEVPINFQNRRAGRSKMQTVLYIRELVGYGIKTRIKNSRQFGKFLIVGSLGFTINTILLIYLASILHWWEPLAAVVATETAIVSNFLFNNFWTFGHNRIHRDTLLWKFIQFNTSSLGAILIQFVIMTLGTTLISPLFQEGTFVREFIYLAYYILAVGIGLFYNYFMYSRVIWKNKPALG